MKFKVLWIACLILAGTVFVTPNAAQCAMLIFGNTSYSYADLVNPSGSNAEAYFTSTVFPTSHLVDATGGDFYSRIQIDYAQSAGGETLSYDLEQKKDGDFSDYAQGQSHTYFTVTADTTYHLSGYYDVQDVTSSGRVFFHSRLVDLTNNNDLFFDLQESRNTLDESFVVGGAGGDIQHGSSGSVSGNLIAGNSYLYHWSADIYSVPDADGGASAVGNFTLTLGHGAAAVPEPVSIAMWGLGVIGLVFARRNRGQMKLTA